MKKKITLIIVLVLILSIAILIMFVRSGSKDDLNNVQNVPPISDNTTISNTTTTNQQTQIMPTQNTPVTELQIKTVQEGKGTGAVAGETVTVNYTGTFEDGKAFDSNTDPKFGHTQPFSFILGKGQVIPGWDKGVLGMKVGEKRHLIIPGDLAYGPSGYGPIPPNATLIFDVELTAIKK